MDTAYPKQHASWAFL